MCVRRVQVDLKKLCKEPLPGIFVQPDLENTTVIHALISGPESTPYEGGFFYFYVDCPDDYPSSAPRVKLLTTGRGSVGFNPNFYADGKVCLSILGTWEGPCWSPVQDLGSVLLSIQSLMTEAPYHNEPGFDQERYPGESERYSAIIRHETLRVAVLDLLEDQGEQNRVMPAEFKAIAEDCFGDFYDFYVAICEENARSEGQAFNCPFRINGGKFRYRDLEARLRAVKQRLDALDS